MKLSCTLLLKWSTTSQLKVIHGCEGVLSSMHIKGSHIRARKELEATLRILIPGI